MGRMGDKPRPILVKFKDLALRNTVWYSKAKMKGSGVTLSEFLTKPRHEAFMAARERVGVKQCWTRDGCVVVLGADGKQHRVVTLAELDQVCPPTSQNVGQAAPKAASSKAPDVSLASSRAKRVASRK
ncbi:uncharacterized protein LOC125488740 [Plutella xylostella]|uniref:uncharacterized protein LOC125488740 n=1 Tax=Plutella xylostella TaxID=51655 RepID=UPI0020324A7F|nr:uncharacterized protein LOC125488740 [Plutella xylostella]